MSSHDHLYPPYPTPGPAGGEPWAQPYGAYPAAPYAPPGQAPHAGPVPPGYYASYGQAPGDSGFLGLSSQRFWTGALIGAAAAYLLTNENVQRATIKSAVKVWSLIQGGFEEMKERFRDAEAEIKAEEETQE
jgi:hypothetical protein